MKNVYTSIVQHYENCFAKHGATHQGVDWPNEPDLFTRFQVMLDVCHHIHEPIYLLDLGCGYGGLYDHLQTTQQLDQFNYTGVDLSTSMIVHAQKQHPNSKFVVRDVLVEPFLDNTFDYIIMNGLLTEKLDHSNKAMIDYATRLIKQTFKMARHGIAFNVMNEHVDWKRDDLFYWPFDHLAETLREHCSRHFTFRADYGLYEYTVYLYKEKQRTK